MLIPQELQLSLEIPGKYHSFCKDNFITIEKKILIIPLTVTLFAIFFVFL